LGRGRGRGQLWMVLWPAVDGVVAACGVQCVLLSL
jgi:hypothetical protein